MLDKILIAEDDVTTSTLLSRYFVDEGFNTLVVSHGDHVVSKLRSFQPDVLLLDVRLPGKSGFDLAREIRSCSKVGLIFVTSRSDDVDKIVGLELGADDYVVKPFNPRELVVRVRNLLSRISERDRIAVGSAEVELTLTREFGDWVLDLQQHKLTSRHGGEVPLTEGEFNLLDTLSNAPLVVLDRERLMSAIVSREWSYNDRSVDVLIGRVRRKLNDDPKSPTYIATVHGTGYRFLKKCRPVG